MILLMNILKGRKCQANVNEDDSKASLLDTRDPNVIEVQYREAVCALLLAALLGALGFWTGQHAFQTQYLPSKDLSTETRIAFQSEKRIPRIFGYSRIFASAPSNETNMAWDALFPSEKVAGRTI